MGSQGMRRPFCPSHAPCPGTCRRHRLSCLFDTLLHNLNLQVTSEQGTPVPTPGPCERTPASSSYPVHLSPCAMPRVCSCGQCLELRRE